METPTKLLVGAGGAAVAVCALLFIGHIFFGLSFTSLLGGAAESQDGLSDTRAAEVGSGTKPKAIVGDSTINLEIADTPAERKQGLSGRSTLASTTGLLFVFDTSAPHGIWMKDMNFAIDIMWLNEGMEIVDIWKNVSPATFPEVFRPKGDARYVLEIAAGGVDNRSVSRGDKIEVVNISHKGLE